MTPDSRSRSEDIIRSLRGAKPLTSEDLFEQARHLDAVGRHEQAIRSREVAVGALDDGEAALEELARGVKGDGPLARAYRVAYRFVETDQRAKTNRVMKRRRDRTRAKAHDEIRNILREHHVGKGSYHLLCRLLGAEPQPWRRPAATPVTRKPGGKRFANKPWLQRILFGTLEKACAAVSLCVPRSLSALFLARVLQTSAGQPWANPQRISALITDASQAVPVPSGRLMVVRGVTGLLLAEGLNATSTALAQVRKGLLELAQRVACSNPGSHADLVLALSDVAEAGDDRLQAPAVAALGFVEGASTEQQVMVFAGAATALRKLGLEARVVKRLRAAIRDTGLSLPFVEQAVRALGDMEIALERDDAEALVRAVERDRGKLVNELSTGALACLRPHDAHYARLAAATRNSLFGTHVVLAAQALAKCAVTGGGSSASLPQNLRKARRAGLDSMEAMRIALQYLRALRSAETLEETHALEVLSEVQDMASSAKPHYVRQELELGLVGAFEALAERGLLDRQLAVADIASHGTSAAKRVAIGRGLFAETVEAALHALRRLEAPRELEALAREATAASARLLRGPSGPGRRYNAVRLGVVAASALDGEEYARALTRIAGGAQKHDAKDVLLLAVEMVENPLHSSVSKDARLSRACAVAKVLLQLVEDRGVIESSVPELVRRLAMASV